MWILSFHNNNKTKKGSRVRERGKHRKAGIKKRILTLFKNIVIWEINTDRKGERKRDRWR